MATTFKVLGQSAPAATTDADLYTVPAATSAICSTLIVANRGATSGGFRVAIRPAGASIANQHYIVFDNVLAANDSVFLTIGVTLAATDVITVRASNANFSFSLCGSELT
jgi:hypothetical protein